MVMTLDDVNLPTNLFWDNEQEFKPFAFSKNRSVTGGMIIQAAALQYGQPIRLIGGWIKRSDLAVLRAMENQPLLKRHLTMVNPQEFTVLFDLEAGGVEATPLTKCAVQSTDDLFDLTLHFITVEPDD